MFKNNYCETDFKKVRKEIKELKSITEISHAISACASDGYLGYTDHANLRLKERKIPKEKLTKAIAENSAIVAVEKKGGDHRGTADRFILLADIDDVPTRVMVSSKKVFSNNRRLTKYVVLTAYWGEEYFTANEGNKNFQIVRNYTVKRSLRPSRQEYRDAYLRCCEKIKKQHEKEIEWNEKLPQK